MFSTTKGHRSPCVVQIYRGNVGPAEGVGRFRYSIGALDCQSAESGLEKRLLSATLNPIIPALGLLNSA